MGNSLEFFLANRQMNIRPTRLVYEDSFGNEYSFTYNTIGEEELSITVSTIFVRRRGKWYMLKSNNEVDYENKVNMNEIFNITSFETLGIDISKVLIKKENNKTFIYIDQSYKKRFNQIFSEFSKMMSINENCPRVD